MDRVCCFHRYFFTCVSVGARPDQVNEKNFEPNLKTPENVGQSTQPKKGLTGPSGDRYWFLLHKSKKHTTTPHRPAVHKSHVKDTKGVGIEYVGSLYIHTYIRLGGEHAFEYNEYTRDVTGL